MIPIDLKGDSPEVSGLVSLFVLVFYPGHNSPRKGFIPVASDLVSSSSLEASSVAKTE